MRTRGSGKARTVLNTILLDCDKDFTLVKRFVVFEDSVNSLAHASTQELRGQLNRLSMASFSSILRSLRVYILKQSR